MPPDLDDAKRLHRFYDAIQQLVAEGRIGAYHDRSDGGLVITALEMAFCSGLGLELDITTVHGDPFHALFAEELGAVVEVVAADAAHVRTVLTAAGADVHAIGRATANDRVRILHGNRRVLDASRTTLRDRWSHVTYEMARRRDDPTCADEEHALRTDVSATGLAAHLTFDPAEDIAAPMIAKGARPRVAILREQGVNGQIEMAAAFTRAGFDAVDVHMTDLIEGFVDLADMAGVVACRRRSATTHAREMRSRSSSIARTRSCSACATAARWSRISRPSSCPASTSCGRASCAIAAIASRRARSC